MLVHLVLAACLATPPTTVARHVAYEVRKVSGVWCHVVRVNLNAPGIKVTGVVSRSIGVLESADSLVNRAKPTVAISGTFHGTILKRPIGDIVIDGSAAYRGHFPSCLAVDWYNRAEVITPKLGKIVDWSNYEFALGGLIRLMRAGKVAPEVGHNTQHVLKPSPRAAVGITPQNKLVMVATRQNVTLSGIGGILKSLGAREAVCLDGGSSTSLYYRGKMLIRPTRALTNLLIVYEDPVQYEARRTVLAPNAKKTARL
ncbi:MAG: phosphodiester glycosidase family protein [Fimbriimonadia bacterium]